MQIKALVEQRPIPIVTTILSVVALAVTAAYFVGLIPIIPKTLPLFARFLNVTVLLFAITALVWVVSFVLS